MTTAQLDREDLLSVLTDDAAFEAYAAAYSPDGERTPTNVAACARVLRSTRTKRAPSTPTTAPRRSPRRWGSRAAQRAAGERSGNDPGGPSTSLSLTEVLADRLHAALLAQPVLTLTDLYAHPAVIGLSRTTIDKIIAALVEDGRLSDDGYGRLHVGPQS